MWWREREREEEKEEEKEERDGAAVRSSMVKTLSRLSIYALNKSTVCQQTQHG